MNARRWNSALIATLAGLSAGAIAVRAQSAPPADPATLARYDTNRNGVIDPNEQAAMDRQRSDSPAAPAGTNADEVIQLSPFQVDATQDKGYFAENTLAGSRLNTNIADLASSISVVTKQQLQDTASLDINDIFLYETNTEGLLNFTQIQGPGMGIVDRTTIKDYGAGYGWGNNPNAVFTASTANRVRGIASPDPAINFYSSIARVPWDSYNTASVDINRGPNSVLFGIGSPAGIVNQNLATAVLNRNKAEVELRTDDLGSFRSALNVNRSLIKDKLAIFVAGLYDRREFERKPSKETTKRYFGAVTYQPFKRTTIRAAAEYYDNYSNRPNYLTPRDYVTPWYEDGRPVYNPVTRMVRYLDTGVTKGPYVTHDTSPGFVASIHAPAGMTRPASGAGVNGGLGSNGLINAPDNMLVGGAGYGINHPLYVRTLSWSDYTRAVLNVHNSQGQYFARQPSIGTAAQGGPDFIPIANRTPENWAFLERRTTSSDGFRVQQPFIVNANGTLTAFIPNYVTPSVTNKAIYDWTKININSMNFGEATAKTYNLEFEQEVVKDLFVQLGWFYQEMDARSNYPLGQQTGATLFVDTNTHLTNGSLNPYFGMPYVSDLESDTFTNPEENDNVRATATYTFDFSHNDNWTQWLGKHRLMGLWTEQNRKQYATRSRFTAIPPSDPRYLASEAAQNGVGFNFANGNTRNVSRRHFYLGQVGGTPGVVYQSAGSWANPGPWGGDGPTDFTIPTYDWRTGAWQDAPVKLSTELWHPGTGGSQRRINSISGAIQSYLWKDRIVGTLGWRRDRYRSRLTPTDIPPDTTNPPFSWWYQGGFIKQGDFWKNRWGPWQYIDEETMTKGVVFHALRWGQGRNQLSFHYNESDNFTAPQSATYDFFGAVLPNPGGEGKDYGVSVSLGDKLYARVTWFETSSTAERVSNNLLQRTVRFDTAITRGWAEAVVRYLSGEDLTQNFANNTLRPLSTDQLARMQQLTGLSTNPAWPTFPISDTQDLKAEGVEISIAYNPTPNWTVKVTGGSQDTKYSNTNKAWESWVTGGRLAYWQGLRVPQAMIDAAPADRRNLNNITVDYDAPTSGGGPVNMNLLNFWNASFGFPGPGDTLIRDTATNGWTTPSGYWSNAVEAEIAVARQFEGRSALNQRKWRGNILTNYEFREGRFKGFSVGGAVRWEDKAIAGYYGTQDRDGDGTIEANETLMERLDINRPIWVPSETHLDVWAAYRTKIFRDKIGLKVQLNIRDATESGKLMPIYYNLDGRAAAYRIVDPRQIILTTTFSF